MGWGVKIIQLFWFYIILALAIVRSGLFVKVIYIILIACPEAELAGIWYYLFGLYFLKEVAGFPFATPVFIYNDAEGILVGFEARECYRGI